MNHSDHPERAAQNSIDPDAGDQSVLHQLEARIGARARVALHDLDPQTDALEGAEPPDAGTADRYRLGDLLGQGGMGTVHKARDRDLGRDVAVKFLHERFVDRPEVLHRFVEEAQIGGQLQHPGIVPVYELGMHEGRPFFAMKMVKGTTLASRLEQRASPSVDRGALLAIFEQVCQTVAYAHARGVVHRDLKPANVMIGSFGEVQVVDWGMGKVLPRQGEAARAKPAAAIESAISIIETVRSQDDGSQSLSGSVMGTPAYMPREQAIGNVGAVDRRSDVFSLGAILCEILTGQPPYVGNARDALAMATLGRVEDAHQRLRQCGADPELVDLAIRCLQAEPAARPESASVVATSVRNHLAATEARAHAATLRALTLKRTQKYGIALTAVIGVGLAASLWFWRDADAQRLRAETNLANFDRLSYVVRLDSARKRAAALFPAWPDKVAAMREWQTTAAEPLRRALPELRATLDDLERRASPRNPAEVEREVRAHPRAAELANMERRLACWLQAADVRAGKAEAAVFSLPTATLPSTPTDLNRLAWPLVDPSRDTFGREAEGVALARHALSLANPADPMWAPLLDTQAWGQLALGLDQAAIESSQAALAAAPPADRPRYEEFLERLRTAVAYANGPRQGNDIAGLIADVAKLRKELEVRRTWSFATDADAFLHGTLRRVTNDIDRFLGEESVAVAMRLQWAERVADLTITRHTERWQQARAAIAAADGVVASKLYAEVPIDLQPQIGLVPIGKNPTTGLWEFYHLRSAWNPKVHPDPADIPVPSYSGTDRIEMDGSGIVFVLVPGGSFRMGAQSQNPNGINYDPLADIEEVPVTEVRLEPFFLAQHEMTQGQWARLTGGQYPSWYIVGNEYGGIPVTKPEPIADRHPVEQVNWPMCAELMEQTGLRLPTEAQWEYACRAGTATPWSIGSEAEGLVEFANVLDHSGANYPPAWRDGEAWDDLYKGPAPVATFRPNPFGFYDMHGNVWEWCQDWFGTYQTSPRPGDGLREPRIHEDIRVSRGGCYQTRAMMARSSYRAYRATVSVNVNVGMRAARAVLK